MIEIKDSYKFVLYDKKEYFHGVDKLLLIPELFQDNIKKIESKYNLDNFNSYDSVQYVGKGLFFVSKEEKKYLVKKNGEVVFECPFYNMYEFYDDVAIIIDKSGFDECYNLINEKFEEILPTYYYSISEFHEGLAIADKRVNNDGIYLHKYGVLDTKGNIVVPFNYSNINYFHEGLAAFREHNGNTGYMDKNGNIQFYNKYKAKNDFFLKDFYDGLAIESNKKGKLGYINKKGKTVVPYIYKTATNFHEGVAIVSKDEDKFDTIIDTNGKEVFSGIGIYDKIYNFYDGLAQVHKNGKMGYINKSGELVIPCIYDITYEFNEGVAIVQNNRKVGAIDKKGNIIIPIIYDNMFYYKNNAFKVRKGNFYGAFDKNGKEILPVSYENIRSIDGNIFIVEVNNKNYIVDINNETDKKLLSNLSELSIELNEIHILTNNGNIGTHCYDLKDKNVELVESWDKYTILKNELNELIVLSKEDCKMLKRVL